MEPHVLPSRYLTGDVPGTGGTLRERPEDFLVEEIPAYEPCGEGEHIYMLVEKRNISALHMMRILAAHFGVRREAVGVAGLKDKAAVTRQMVSVHVPGKRPEDFPAVQHEGLTVHWTALHTNKLRRGHLKGNRFIIRIRGVEASKAVYAHKVLGILERTGVPNRAGVQRFGHLQNNHLVGRALILGDDEGVLRELLGPNQRFPQAQAGARALYTEGRYEDAMSAFASAAHTERRVLAALSRGAKARRAVEAIERMQRGFYISAFQSAVFNAVLDDRLGTGRLADLGEGDLAFKHDSGAVFAVDGNGATDPALRERLARLEISPTGPMWGPEMTRAGGTVGELELRVLQSTGVGIGDLEAYAKRRRDSMEGQRRPLRVPLAYPDVEGGVDEVGGYVKCRFELPRGAFATVVMQEIMKTESAISAEEEDRG